MDKPKNNPEWVLVDPETAKRWLATVPAKQRGIKPGNIDKMARDQAEGRWTQCYDCFVFNQRKELVNGQNRCHSIVKSGKSLWFLVMYEAPDDAIQHIDIGVVRTPADTLAFSGEISRDESRAMTTMARTLYQGIGGRAVSILTNDELNQYTVKHQDKLRWALKQFTQKERGIHRAPVIASVARAYQWSKSRGLVGRLEKFCELLHSGVASGDSADVGVIKLRDYLMRGHDDTRGAKAPPKSGGSSGAEISRYVTRHLKAYLTQEPLKRLTGTSDNLFPLPDDPE